MNKNAIFNVSTASYSNLLKVLFKREGPPRRNDQFESYRNRKNKNTQKSIIKPKTQKSRHQPTIHSVTDMRSNRTNATMAFKKEEQGWKKSQIPLWVEKYIIQFHCEWPPGFSKDGDALVSKRSRLLVNIRNVCRSNNTG